MASRVSTWCSRVSSAGDSWASPCLTGRGWLPYHWPPGLCQQWEPDWEVSCGHTEGSQTWHAVPTPGLDPTQAVLWFTQ